jgi:SNF2 family DNA or RNA helicase
VTYKPSRKPWKHQAEALRRLEGRTAFALLMAMRTGKSKVAIDDYGRLELAGETDDILIIAPAGVYKTWIKELKDHASADLISRLHIHAWSAKDTGKNAMRLFSQFMGDKSQPRALLVNIEAISAVKRARELVIDFLKSRRVYTIVDESTTIKNHSSQRSKFVVEKIGPLASHRRILSGLPTPRSPLDIYQQFEFLQPGSLGHPTFNTFKARYAIEEKVCMLPNSMLAGRLEKKIGKTIHFNGIGTLQVKDLKRADLMREMDRYKIWYPAVPIIKGYRNEEELRDKIAPLSYRVRLDECYDLPPKMYSIREVALTPEQLRVYTDIKEKATAELASMTHVTALNVISRILRCHQVLCGHVGDENGVIQEIEENRTASLLELLEETSGKVIIWCSYDYNIRQVSRTLMKEYGEESVARFWGGNISVREAEEKRFREDPKCRFMVATPHAGGRGRLWVVADLVVYYSNTDNLEHRDQSEERAQGIDKVNSVAYVDLMTPGTVDEKIIRALRRKIDMATTITGDDWREWLI